MFHHYRHISLFIRTSGNWPKVQIGCPKIYRKLNWVTIWFWNHNAIFICLDSVKNQTPFVLNLFRHFAFVIIQHYAEILTHINDSSLLRTFYIDPYPPYHRNLSSFSLFCLYLCTCAWPHAALLSYPSKLDLVLHWYSLIHFTNDPF